MSRILSVSLNKKEQEVLEKASTLSGLSKGALLKIPFFGRENIVYRKRPTADRKELANIAGLLGMFGSNLNQVAHHLNAGTIPPSGELIKSLKESQHGISEIGELVKTALNGGGRDE